MFWGEKGNQTAQKVLARGEISYRQEGFVSGTLYEICLQASNVCGRNQMVCEEALLKNPPAKVVPKSVVAQDCKIGFGWKSEANTTYEVQILDHLKHFHTYDACDEDKCEIPMGEIMQEPFGLKPGDDILYRIRGKNEFGIGPWSK